MAGGPALPFAICRLVSCVGTLRSCRTSRVPPGGPERSRSIPRTRSESAHCYRGRSHRGAVRAV